MSRRLLSSTIILWLVACAHLASANDSRQQSLNGDWIVVRDSPTFGDSESTRWPQHFPEHLGHNGQVPGIARNAVPDLQNINAASSFWYEKKFFSNLKTSNTLHPFLHFDGVRYSCTVWLNGVLLGTHEGSESAFDFDVAELLHLHAQNTLVVHVDAPALAGIWKDVNLINRPPICIEDVFAKPDLHSGKFTIEVTVQNRLATSRAVSISITPAQWKPRVILPDVQCTLTAVPGQSIARIDVPLQHPHAWDLTDPFLYAFTTSIDSNPPNQTDPDLCDTTTIRAGLRDFCISQGWFCLNGRRLFIKSLHGIEYDAVTIIPTPNAPSISDEYTQLKSAGFNMMRYIDSAVTPQQLDRADELGFLIYSEHETSWAQKNPVTFAISLPQSIRLLRNHPSLVMWGLRNETLPGSMATVARQFLPTLRQLDPTRLVEYSSGRWDGDATTGSASNPGSNSWNVFLGGEDPHQPQSTGQLPEQIDSAFHDRMGDIHFYQHYPTSWKFIDAFGRLAENTKPVFVAEAGIGSAYNPYDERSTLQHLKAPPNALAWTWVTPTIDAVESAWKKYQLDTVYPRIQDYFKDSSLNAARQRREMFSIVRSNAKINGYSLTSLIDCYAIGEGVMTSAHEFKPGHLSAMKDGWAPLRWCLLINPTSAYVTQPLHLKVSLVNENILPAGDYLANLTIGDANTVVWSTQIPFHVPADDHAPFAYPIFDQLIRPAPLRAGDYKLTATIAGQINGSDSELSFIESDPVIPSTPIGPITVLNLSASICTELTKWGGQPRLYVPGNAIDHQVILVGDHVADHAQPWRDLYTTAASGAQIIFLDSGAFALKKNDPLHWLAVPHRGQPSTQPDWLYHKDCIAKPGPVFDSLPVGLMTPDFYQPLLTDTHCLFGVSTPDQTLAAGIYCAYVNFQDGVMLGTYQHHAGAFTVNAFNSTGSVQTPAGDRLLLNLIKFAQARSSPVQPLPPGYPTELDTLKIVDPTRP